MVINVVYKGKDVDLKHKEQVSTCPRQNGQTERVTFFYLVLDKKRMTCLWKETAILSFNQVLVLIGHEDYIQFVCYR